MDAYQEALDLVVYLRQAIAERPAFDERSSLLLLVYQRNNQKSGWRCWACDAGPWEGDLDTPHKPDCLAVRIAHSLFPERR